MPPFGSFFYMMPVIKGENVILTIHYYIGGTWDGVTGYKGITFDDHEKAISTCVNIGLNSGLPLWIGELGVGSASYKAKQWVEDVLYLFDRYALDYA